MDETIYTVAAACAIILPWFGLYAAVKLQRLSRSPEGRGIKALRERADVAVILAIASFLGGTLGLNRFFDLLGDPVLRGGAIVLILAFMIILTSLPGLYWTTVYKRDGFHDTSTD